jgi:hypothetical protein
MNRLLLVCGIVLLSVTASAEPPKDTVTIPLDRVWANGMHGCRSVYDLVPEGQRADFTERFTRPIGLSLSADSSSRWPREDQIAGPGFAVSGTSLEALEALYEIMVKDKPPRTEFSTDDEISLVFLMYQFGSYAQIQQIERRGTDFEIRWRFVRPINKILTGYFALIPVGKLPDGHHRVCMKQQPLGVELESREYGDLKNSSAEIERDLAWGRRFVGGDFSFEVRPGQQ